MFCVCQIYVNVFRFILVWSVRYLTVVKLTLIYAILNYSGGHLGNIAMLLGRDIRWDPVKEEVIGDLAANRMLGRPWRAPWNI